MTAAGPRTVNQGGDALQRVEKTVRKSGSSFFWGMRLLPRERREAIYAVYAYCREVDDIADGDAPDSVKHRQLAEWRAEVERLYAGTPTHPVTRALAAPVRRFGLPKEELLAILDGMERDARGGIVAPTDAALRSYCRQVAGAVGMLAMHIFADGDTRADRATCEELAITLGEGLQLTNILRDLGDDAARGRLYLPEEVLQAAGVTAREPRDILRDPALPAACAMLARTARQRFARSRALMERLDKGTARPCRLMLEIYARILDTLETSGWRHPERRVRVPKWTKLWIVLRHGIL
ncbi:presqualene diphosphate synthase HpnD [Ferruginivarius sediminum]|uniref:Squalene synthase HpnD n=1 Tax=Ferruginivarius sediminum TaxID=2661937 RepID=A0A369T727_9PROT|nr:presqualene diphosphate synthase HpnD [Ferruginivarius sediminum]RDD61133.1 squalene synthase HpnD [Ferruginivarius sediminum]